MSMANALSGLATAIKGLRVTRKKLEIVIAQKVFEEKDFDQEMREKARVNRKLANLRKRKALAEAASENKIVSAPSPAEIRAVTQTIRAVEQLALRDAMRRQGLKMMKGLATKAAALGDKTRVIKT